MRILLIEDNRRLHASLRRSLEEDGYAVDSCYDGQEGEICALTAPLRFDHPGDHAAPQGWLSGLRRQKVRTLILMLTARDAIEDRIAGLDHGADDDLVKPFAMQELRALLRRELPEKTACLQIGDLNLSPANHHVERAATPSNSPAANLPYSNTSCTTPNNVNTSHSPKILYTLPGLGNSTPDRNITDPSIPVPGNILKYA